MKSKALKNSLIGLVVMIVLSAALILCANPLYAALSGTGRSQETESGESGYTPGTYVVEEEGFGGIVTVTVTVDDKSIVDVAIDAPDETPEIGGAAAQTLASDILKNQTADTDGVSGATFTSTAVKTAVSEALSMAKSGAGAGAVDMSYTPGTYEAEEQGMFPMTVRVTFDDSSIVDIEIENTETEGIGSVAVEELPPEIIEKQSLAVDGISGATLSSTAILAGVEDCIIQAGGDADALK